MDEQGGAGGVPLHHGPEDIRRHGEKTAAKPAERRTGRTAAADTDEASRLDHPVEPRAPGGPARWAGPREERGGSRHG
jgi:hypothetical protein